MSHTHPVLDSDPSFVIDPITREVLNTDSEKRILMQYDHNSERFTFEIDRYVEGHDMSLCNKVEIHYINTGSSSVYKKTGIYLVEDFEISKTDLDGAKMVFSWLISGNATNYVGKLSFLIAFACTENNEVVYRWHTAINSDIDISTGMNNSEIVIETYPDILEQWREELFADIIAENEAQVDGMEEKVDEWLAEFASKSETFDAWLAEYDNKVEALSSIRWHPVTAEQWAEISQEDFPTSADIYSQVFTPAGWIDGDMVLNAEGWVGIVIDSGGAVTGTGVNIRGAQGPQSLEGLVDSELSDLSENPVQNKVIKEEFDKHQVESYRDEYGASVELTNINGRGIVICTRYDLANGPVPVLELLWNDNDEPVRVNAIESPLDDYDAANKVYVDDTVNDKVIEAAKSKLLNGLDENGDPIPMEFSDWDSIYDYPKGNAVPAGKSCFIADLALPGGDDDPIEFLVFVDKHPCGWNAGMGCYDIDVVGTDTCYLFTYWTDRYGNWYSCCRGAV